jgi:hypothetical protein
MAPIKGEQSAEAALNHSPAQSINPAKRRSAGRTDSLAPMNKQDLAGICKKTALYNALSCNRCAEKIKKYSTSARK